MIYLMRHGQDDERFIGGWSDVGLTFEGKMHVRWNALWLKNNLSIKKIICSDIKRAIQTAEIIKAVNQLDYTLDTNLREQSKGLLNGMDSDLAKKLYPMYFENITVDTVYPKGECLRDLYNRINNYLELLLKLEDDTLLITHRGVINMIYYILESKELDMNKSRFNVDVASIHELDQENKKIRRIK